MKAATKTAKFASLRDLWTRAQAGEEMAQKVCVGALNNLGCDHLAHSAGGRPEPKWAKYHRGLEQYLDALVSEYGVSETKAERELLAEVNMARTYSDDVSLFEWDRRGWSRWM